MKAVILRGAGQLACETIPDPILPPDGLIIQVEACGICGSDIRAYRHGFRFEQSWQVLGHEIAGVVIEVGAEVHDYALGERLAVAADVHCKQCYYCKRGWFNLCENWQLVGTHFPGGMAEYMQLPAAILRCGIVHRIPEGVTATAGALAEPASSVLASQAALDIQPSEIVAIIGDGAIGALQVQTARARGAAPILIGRNVERLHLMQSRQLGMEYCYNTNETDVVAAVRSLTEGRGADAAIVACASKSAQVDAVNMVRKRGRVAIFGGLPKNDPITCLDSNRIHYDELSLIGTFSYHPDFHAQALDMISKRQIEAHKIVTATFPLDDVQAAFAAVIDHQQLKVMLTPGALTSEQPIKYTPREKT